MQPASAVEIFRDADAGSGGSFGSGYLLGAAHVLTARHVVCAPHQIATAVRGLRARQLSRPPVGTPWHAASCIWDEPQLDLVTTDDGTQFRPTLELGTDWGGAALLFVAGFASGGRGALLSVTAWCLVNLGIPLAILGPDPGAWGEASVGLNWVLVPGVGLVDSWDSEQYSASGSGELSISTYIGTSLVGTDLGLAPGWALGPLDLLFAVFGWRVHRVLLQQPGGQAREEAAIARAEVSQFGIPTDLPSLRVRYADRLLIWPTGLVVLYGVIGVLVALTTLVAALW